MSSRLRHDAVRRLAPAARRLPCNVQPIRRPTPPSHRQSSLPAISLMIASIVAGSARPGRKQARNHSYHILMPPTIPGPVQGPVSALLVCVQGIFRLEHVSITGAILGWIALRCPQTTDLPEVCDIPKSWLKVWALTRSMSSQASRPPWLAQLHLHVVVATIIHQWHGHFRLLAAVGNNPLHGQAVAAVADGDVVEGFAVAVVDLER